MTTAERTEIAFEGVPTYQIEDGLEVLTHEGLTMRLTITIGLDNAALKDESDALDRESLAQIVTTIGNDIREDNEQGAVWDPNGNRIGAWTIDD